MVSESWSIRARVLPRRILDSENAEDVALEVIVRCGPDPKQKVRWLGQVAIAIMDEENYKGWEKMYPT